METRLKKKSCLLLRVDGLKKPEYLSADLICYTIPKFFFFGMTTKTNFVMQEKNRAMLWFSSMIKCLELSLFSPSVLPVSTEKSVSKCYVS